MSDELEQFKLEDGSTVACGNLQPATLPNLFAEFPQSKMLDNDDIKRLLGPNRYKENRREFSKWIINQSSIGKCNTSAAVGALYRIKERNGHAHVPLADNYMYMHINGGRDRGSQLSHGMTFGRDQGLCPRVLTINGREFEFPHLAYSKRQIPREALEEAARQARRFKMHEPYRVPKDWEGFKRTIATACAREYPIVNAWHVSNSSMRLRNGYVQQGRGPGNHATIFFGGRWVGGRDLVHPDLCNSWGPVQSTMYGPRNSGWGDGGYGLMTMEDAFQCRQYHDFYVLPGVHEDSVEDAVL